MYSAKNKEKICSMRPDTLAQVMSQSGIYSGCKVLVFESLVGLIVGAAAYRLRGNGRILAIYGAQQPHLELVSALNLDDKSVEIIQPIPSVELGPAARDVRYNGLQVETQEAVSVALPSASSSKREVLSGDDEDGDVSGNRMEEDFEGIAGELMASASTAASDVGGEDAKQQQQQSEERGKATASKPYQASGRQPEDLKLARSALRSGADRSGCNCSLGVLQGFF